MSKIVLQKKLIVLISNPVLKRAWNAVYCIAMLISCIVRTFINPAILLKYSDRFTDELLRPFDTVLTTLAARIVSLGTPLLKSAYVLIKRLTLLIISG